MKATLDVPDELYRQVKAKSALEGRSIREVALTHFERYLAGDSGSAPRPEATSQRELDGEPLPAWFGSLRKYTRNVQRHDMEAIRESIAAGLAKEHGL